MSPAVAVKLLGIIGTPEEIQAEIGQLEYRASVSPKAGAAYAPAIEELKSCLKDAERASESLLLAVHETLEETDNGELVIAKEAPGLWIELDPDTKHPKLHRAGKTGRPTNVYNEWIANFAEAIAARLEQETGKPAKPSQVCEEVARRFSPLFPPDYLDTSPRGNVYTVWRNRETRRQKLVREIEQLAPSEEAVAWLIERSGAWVGSLEKVGVRSTRLPIASGAWRSTPWIYLLEELRDLAKEAAGDGRAEL